MSGWDLRSDQRMGNIFNLNYPPRCLLACWERNPLLGRNEASLESRAECKQERKTEKKKNRKEKSLHKIRERAEDCSEIVNMGASREDRGLEWGFSSRMVRE